jgi:serine/threonine-protein kinase
MSLGAGERLGPYESLALIGAGGMGEVYRARDLRLDRIVAIKVSGETFSERFEREARAIAALNHPNICTLFDVGPNYLVMEMVEGETLAERLRRGPIPLDEALRIARQIADALQAAHEKGIVHRDLKPSNIKLKKDGAVKVLDFGLAKLVPSQQADSSAQDSTTLTLDATQPGIIVGTAGYMPPEQVRGQAVDKRADIWAFGVVLYEMLTGRKVFQRDTLADTFSAVLTAEPDWTSLPVKVRRLVRQCLEVEPQRRLRDIGDAWLLLSEQEPAAPAERRRSWPLIGTIAALSILAGILVGRAVRSHEPSHGRLVRLNVGLGLASVPGSQPGPSVILSLAGDRLAFIAQSRLFTRKLDQQQTVELPDTDGAFAPFFSPDGQWIAFFARGKLKKISVAGGAPMDICDATTNARGGTWGERDQIIAALGSNDTGLSLVSAAGGAPQPLTTLDREHGEITERWPQILPGGKAVLFTTHTAVNRFDEANIDVYSLSDHRRHRLHRGGTYGRYLETPNGGGYLVYVNRGTLFATPFDLNRMEAPGAPVPVLQEVSYSPSFGSAEFDYSRDGTLSTERAASREEDSSPRNG